MRNYKLGQVSYVVTLSSAAISWQVYTFGFVGLIFESSSVFPNSITAVGLPTVPVIAFHFSISTTQMNISWWLDTQTMLRMIHKFYKILHTFMHVSYIKLVCEIFVMVHANGMHLSQLETVYQHRLLLMSIFEKIALTKTQVTGNNEATLSAIQYY